MIYRLHNIDHDEMGRGWAPAWMDNPWPSQALALTHDIMEHQREPSITSDLEAEAIGASIVVRYLGGWHSRKGKDLGMLLGGDMSFAWEHVHEFGYITPARSAPLRGEHAYLEWEFQGAKIQAKRDRLYSDGPRPDDEWYDSYISHIRRGFRKALRRYRHRDPSELGHDFECMKRGIEEALSLSDRFSEIHVDFTYKHGYKGTRVIAVYEPEHSKYEAYR